MSGDFPVLSISGVRQGENKYVTFTVTLSEPAADAVTVGYRTLAGTATLGGDVALIEDTLTFAVGETSQSFTLLVDLDYEDELDESYFVELFNPVGATFAGGNRVIQAVGWALDDDGAGNNRAIAISNPTVVEGESNLAQFTLSLSEAFTSATTFEWSTFDGSARAGSDYKSAHGTVTFAAGQLEADVQVELLNDAKIEPGESFGLKVTGATGGATGTATILNDDGATPVLSISGVRQGENKYVTFTVTLSEPAADAVTVGYRTLAGTATLGGDVALIEDTLTFAVGETSQSFTMLVDHDYEDELDESYFVELFNPVGATFAGGNRVIQAVGWALDDDGAGNNRAIAISNPTVVEGESNLAQFTLSLSEAFTSATTFEWSTFDGSARAGSDYKSAHGTVTFAAGQLEADVQVELLNDAKIEPGESFGLKVTGATGGATGTATILNDDGATPVLSISGVRQGENKYVTFTVTLSEPAADAVTVGYRTLAGTATLGGDVPRIENTLTFAVGETSQSFTLLVDLDYEDELDESYFVELFNPVGATFAGGNRVIQAVGWALDDDGAGNNRAIAISNPTVVEGESNLAQFTLSLSEAFTSATTFEWSTFDGSARAGSDYKSAHGTVTFAAGQLEADVQVELLNDAKIEPGESFGLKVTGATGGATGTATILNDDGATPVLSISGVRQGENKYVTFTVTLSEPAADAVTVGYRTLAGTATLGGDVALIEDTLTFAVGETSQSFTMLVDHDYEDELDESYFVELFNPVGATFAGGNRLMQAVGWALDDDGAGNNRAIAISNPTVVEGDVATFAVDISRPYTSDISLEYKTVAVSANAGSDFKSITGNVTFSAGQTRAYVQVPIFRDLAFEGNEAFGFKISSLSAPLFPAGSLPGLGIATIIDGSLRGTVEGNTLRGTSLFDAIDGLAGDDRLFGLSGNDVLVGGSGQDWLNGGSGADRMKGGEGNDTYIVDNLEDRTIEKSGGGNDIVRSSISIELAAQIENLTLTGKDNLNGTGNIRNNILTGNAGDNRLAGRIGSDTLMGHGGNDTVSGDAGNDKIVGGMGRDVLLGGSGRDTLIGGSGNDTLAGGAGYDTFVFARNGGKDTVRDYNDGEDRIKFNIKSADFSKISIVEKGADVSISFRGVVMTLENTDLADWDGQISYSASFNQIIRT